MTRKVNSLTSALDSRWAQAPPELPDVLGDPICRRQARHPILERRDQGLRALGSRRGGAYDIARRRVDTKIVPADRAGRRHVSLNRRSPGPRLLLIDHQPTAEWRHLEPSRAEQYPSSPPYRQEGHAVDLASWPGPTMLLVLFLTLCSDICPLTTGNLSQVERSLRDDGAASQVEVVELTVDPDRDTPARLAAYAHITGATWPLVTESDSERTTIAKFFGFFYQQAPRTTHPRSTGGRINPLPTKSTIRTASPSSTHTASNASTPPLLRTSTASSQHRFRSSSLHSAVSTRRTHRGRTNCLLHPRPTVPLREGWRWLDPCQRRGADTRGTCVYTMHP